MKSTSTIAQEIANIRELTDEDLSCLTKLILDFYAASFAGYAVNERFNDRVRSVRLAAGGAEESSVFMSDRKYPAQTAAFMNAVYAHGAELDDGHKGAMGHSGTHVIPAVFALAEKLGSDNREVLTAIAAGYEAYIRISSAAQPGMVSRGVHSTGAAGSLACAAACAHLMGLDADGIEQAIALATTMSGGLLSYGDSMPEIKPLNPARAAETGVMAAMLAATGMRGPEEALEGQNGWFHTFSDTLDESRLVRRDGEPLLMHGCYYKLYPSCRHTHCGIEAAVNLHQRCKDGEIDKINVYIYPNAIRLAGLSHPKNQDETKFSIAYTLAVALLKGSYGIGDMDVSKASEDVWQLAAKVNLVPDESMEDRDRGIRGARVEVVMKDGSSEEETVLVPKGDPEKPLTVEDIRDKLTACAGDMAGGDKLNELYEEIVRLSEPGAFRYPGAILG